MTLQPVICLPSTTQCVVYLEPTIEPTGQRKPGFTSPVVETGESNRK